MRTLLLLLFIVLVGGLPGQQVADTSFTYRIPFPAFEGGAGPVVAIDGAHNNLHTREGGFLPFSRLLERDGFRVIASEHPLDGPELPAEIEVLVIVNALHPANQGNWVRPINSAFSPLEIKAVVEWVREGGRLLLIADHMPFAGAASALAGGFGFKFLDGFAQTGNGTWPPTMFRRGAGLPSSPVVEGDRKSTHIDSVASFTGSAFRKPQQAVPVLSFQSGHRSLQPDTAWVFHPSTPAEDLEGYYQGALLQFGKGRIAIFGEAAMFTAQLANGSTRAGFNAPEAPQNAPFVLNVLRWLVAD